MVIREANIGDHTAILYCIVNWLKETPYKYPPVLPVITNWISGLLLTGHILVACTETGEVIGTVGMGFNSFPWNHQKMYLAGEWFYVRKEHRKSNTAKLLLTEIIKYADEKKFPVMFGFYNGVDADRKDRFMEANGLNYVGGNFVYGFES